MCYIIMLGFLSFASRGFVYGMAVIIACLFHCVDSPRTIFSIVHIVYRIELRVYRPFYDGIKINIQNILWFSFTASLH